MRIIGFSINHRTCDIKLREAVALDDGERENLIKRLKAKGFDEGIVLSTCNRTEVLTVANKEKLDVNALVLELLQVKNIIGVNDNNYDVYYDEEAVNHLFAVATGIDSLIVGDSQILGQVKEAFQFSLEHDFIGTVFNKLQLSALKVGKRVITETEIGKGAVSVSFAAVKMIEKYFYSLRDKNVLIIGAGETAELAAVHIVEKNPQSVVITNRTREKGEQLAEKLNAEFVPFDEYKNDLHKYDVILSATSSPEYILTFDEIKSAVRKRKGKFIVILDIALPRDVEPKVAELDEVFYQDIDSLKLIIDKNIERRKAEIPKVKEIIENEVRLFYDWFNTLDVLPTVKKLRAFFEEIRKDEFEKIKYKLHEHELEKVENMTKRLIGRILHNPTVNLKKMANDAESEKEKMIYSQIIRDLFNLDKNSAEENKTESL